MEKRYDCHVVGGLQYQIQNMNGKKEWELVDVDEPTFGIYRKGKSGTDKVIEVIVVEKEDDDVDDDGGPPGGADGDGDGDGIGGGVEDGEDGDQQSSDEYDGTCEESECYDEYDFLDGLYFD